MGVIHKEVEIVDPVPVNEALVQTALLPSTSLTEPNRPQTHGILTIVIATNVLRLPVERTKIPTAALARDSHENVRGLKHVSRRRFEDRVAPPLD
jgi:hypothetical protein